jgi:hypothetical protein
MKTNNTFLDELMKAPTSRSCFSRTNLTSFLKASFIVLLCFLLSGQLRATTYYSNGNQAPNVLSNWWTNTNGTGSHPANFTTANNIFTVQNGHTMTTTANWTISGTGAGIIVQAGGALVAANTITTTKLTINASGNVTVNSGKTLKINNGTSSPDLNVPGTLTNSGTITIAAGANASFGSGGKYRHTMNGGTIPTATWDINSTCEITGITTTTPGGLTGQSFGNFTWNCTQTGNIQLAGKLTSITGNFSVQGTGTSQLRLTNTTNLTMTIGGNFDLSNGIVNFANAAAVTKVFNLGGNFNQTGGTFTNSNSVPMSFYFTGYGKTFASSGILTNTYINWIVKTGASLTLLNNLPVAASRSCTVNGTLNCNTLAVTGAGTFTLASAGTLQMGSPAGITTSSATGNILVTGARSYNTGANYIYSSGTGSPVTGNGLPATVNNFTVSTSSTNPLTITGNTLTVAGNFTISSGGKLELSATNQLTVQGTTSLTGSNCFILRSNATSTASFVNTGSISGTGTTRIDRYINKNWDWHFLSSPVNAEPIWNNTFDNFTPVPAVGNIWTPGLGTTQWEFDFYRWAPQGDPNGYTPYPWVNLHDGSGLYNSGSLTVAPYGFGPAIPIFLPGTGYLVAYSSLYGLQTQYFSGSLNTGTINIPLVRGTGTNGNGQAYINNLNLIGNPYPSAIDFDAIYSGNSGVLTTATYWIMLGDGSYASYTVGSGGTAGASRYIAPMQGFDVYTGSTTNLTLTNAMRLHNSQVWLKEAETFTNRLSVRVSSDANNFSDEIIVHFDPSFSPDGGAIKLSSFVKEAPNLYTEKQAGKFSISQLNSTESSPEVPLCLVPGVAANYTFNANGIEGFDLNTPILLHDMVSGLTTDLSKNSTYTFSAQPGDNPNRFVLSFGQVNGIQDASISKLFKIFTSDRNFVIENYSGTKNFQVSLYDMRGSLQMQQSAEGSSVVIEKPVAPGMYIVKVFSDKGTASQKVVVR